MSGNEKHPMRCETCHKENCPAKHLVDPYGCAKDWIGVVGCASHSSMTKSSTEPMYLISEFQLHQLRGYANLDFICQAIRARGPVSAASPALIQCKTCIFKGRRECIEHGYPDECIKSSCEFKIGKLAVIAPLEAQMRNRERDATIEQAAREKVLDVLIESFFTDPVGRNNNEVALTDEIIGRIESFRNPTPKEQHKED